MSRAIKFRAWDSDLKKMFTHFMVSASSGSVVTPGGASFYDTVLMQFTGLHDKNGKEIWEGDIIQECHVGEIIWDGDGMVRKCPIGVVEWGYSGWNIKQNIKGIVDLKDGSQSEINLDKYDGQFQWDGTEIEVLGNIYEHGDLLK